MGTVGAFALSAVVLRPFVGRISDKRGRRLLVTAGGILVGAAIAAYALVDSLAMLVALRVVTGIGEAFYYVGVASVISDISPSDRRGEAFSYFSLALFGGLALGPVIGETALDIWSFSAVWVAAGACSFFAASSGSSYGHAARRRGHPGGGRLLHPRRYFGTVLATNSGACDVLVVRPVVRAPPRPRRVAHGLRPQLGDILLIRSFGARLPDRLGPRVAGRAALTSR